MNLDELREACGPHHVVTDPQSRKGYETDWTGLFGGPALAVVRPGSAEQVARVLRWASRLGVPVIPQGGNTGLVGGGVPAASGPLPLIVSTRRLATAPVVHGDTMTAGAGATLADIQRAARAAGRTYGVDLAARDSATIGGTVATNAGGIRVCRFGMTRAQVRGVEAVLADGRVVRRMSDLRKDNTGYDLAALLTGSEGTLAVITAVRVSLHGPLPESVVAVAAVGSLAEAVRWASRQGDGLQAAEVVDRQGWSAAGGPDPGPGDWIALVEADALTAEIPDHALVAVDAEDRARLWRAREMQSDLADRLGVTHKVDVSLPVERLDAFDAELRRMCRAQVFGHVADGSLHIQMLDGDPHDVLDLVIAEGGAVSSEHGIGRAKTAEVLRDRGEDDIAAMRAVKRAWDPGWILNPGVLLQT